MKILKINIRNFKFVIVIGLILYGLIYAYSLTEHNYNIMGEIENTPIVYPVTFLDLRSLTSALDCFRSGIDPMIANPCDITNRPFNYPRIWLGLSYLRIGEDNTALLGSLLVFSFYFVFVFIFLQKLSLKTAFFYLFLLLSPAVLLAIERGNIDLGVFVLVVISLALFRMKNSKYDKVAYIVLFCAAILKVFPIFVIGTLFFRETRKSMQYFVAGIMGIFLAYIGLTWSDIKAININTPHMFEWSYGYDAIFLILKDSFKAFGIPALVEKLSPFVALVLAGITSVYIYSKQRLSSAYQGVQDGEYLDSFRAGASIFVGTFLLGTNFDYRLIFLLLCIPQLIVWFRKERKITSLSGITLLLLCLTLWAGFWVRGTLYPRIVEESINWGIWIGLSIMLLLTIPNYWRKSLENIAKRLYTRFSIGFGV